MFVHTPKLIVECTCYRERPPTDILNGPFNLVKNIFHKRAFQHFIPCLLVRMFKKYIVIMVACCVLYAHEILGGKSYIFPFQKANEAAVVVAILREHGVMSV